MTRSPAGQATTRSTAAPEQATKLSSAARAPTTRSRCSGATYTIADNRGGSPDGTDTVTNVENFQFSDGTLTASQLNAPPRPPPNKIALENLKQGNPESEWGIDGDGDYTSIQGFATEISSNIGQTVDFKIATDSTNYRIDIYRLGYYGGDGARKVASIDKTLTTAQVQPHPIVDMSRGLIDAGNWAVSASWADSAGCGLRRLHRQAGPRGRHRRREPYPLHRPRRQLHQQHRLPDLRHDLAGLQRLGRRQPLFRRSAGRSRPS